MTSRDRILAALRDVQIPEMPLPENRGQSLIFDDHIPSDLGSASKMGDCPLFSLFSANLEAAGGACWRVASLDEAQAKLDADTVYQNTEKRYCAIDGLAAGNYAPAQDTAPNDLAALDAAVLPGTLGVAENGAVWVSHAALPHRAVPFACLHLYVVLPVAALHPDMHRAYAALDQQREHSGYFIAGPSKTADIEQCLVIGAQGPKAATVILVG